MDLFIDTNVIIGYCIEVNHWHYYAMNLMKNENIYWSTTVKDESEEKLEELRKIYSNFFQQMKEDIDEDILSKKELIELTKSIKYINKQKVPFEQENLAKLLWSKGGWLNDVNSEEFIDNLNSISIGMNKRIFSNFKHCNEVLNLHERKDNLEYSQLVGKLEKLERGKRKIHNPDSEILVDCHDLSISQNIDIGFISGDGDIIFFKKEIMEMTNIAEIIYLKNVHAYNN